MATVRMAATSLLTTVSETANTVTNLVSSVGTGAKMINDFTTNAREQQLTNIKLSKVGFLETLKVTKALEIDEAQLRLSEYIGNDPAKKARIDLIMAEFDKVLA